MRKEMQLWNAGRLQRNAAGMLDGCKGLDMRITDSNILMGSGRDYQSQGRGRSQSLADGFSGVAGSLYARQRDSYCSGQEFSGTAYSYTSTGSGYTYDGVSGTKDLDASKAVAERQVLEDQPTKLQKNILDLLLRRFTGSSLRFQMLKPGMGMTFQSSPATLTERIISYQEQEDTRFAAEGVAHTEDGREIDFQVAIEMSRSYMEYMDFQIPMLAASLADPLVVNIGSDITQVTDQTFRFDLDADGTEEEVAMLGKGSGFLALDLNEDGQINDGSELFGTQSGNGFEDLRKYDSDGNGWIDENDAVFEKLKVWCKNADGEELLMDLKEADIGAIFLGEAATEFSLYGDGGMQNGQLRSTGVFLKESGGVGTVQHVDLATYDPQQLRQYRDERLRETSKAKNRQQGQDEAFILQSKAVLQLNISGQPGLASQNSTQSVRRTDSSSDQNKEREEAYQRTDYKTVQKKLRLERSRLAEAAAKKRAQQKRVAKELADEQFAKKQKLEDARLEKLFEDRERREAFFEEDKYGEAF